MNKNSYYFKTQTRPQVGDIVATCRNGQGVITSLMDDDTSFTFINTHDCNVYSGDLTSDSDLIERPKQLTEVIFRRFRATKESKGTEIIALFPTLAADLNVNHCLSYMNCGQHGAASIDLISSTVPAHIGDKEVNDLFLELTRAGYFLKVISRFTPKHRAERNKQIV